MCDRIRQVLLTCRTVAGQGKFVFENVVPRRNARRVAEVMIAANNIDADTGIVNRPHCITPRLQLALQFCLVDIAVDQVTANQDKVNLFLYNLGGKLAQNGRIHAVIVTLAVTGSDESPRRVCITRQRNYR
jgi:hypothetical protein